MNPLRENYSYSISRASTSTKQNSELDNKIVEPLCQKISGWEEDQSILLQQNLNVSRNKLNQLGKPSIKVTNYARQTRLSGGSRERNRKKSQSGSVKNAVNQVIASPNQGSENIDPFKIQGFFGNNKRQTTEYFTHLGFLRNELSNIEILKIQAKHLQNQEISKQKLPIFLTSNHSQVLTPESSNNSSQLQKKKWKKMQIVRREPSISQISQSSMHPCSQNVFNHSSKFYKTMTNQWMNCKNFNLVIQPSPLNSTNKNEHEDKCQGHNLLNQNDRGFKKNGNVTQFSCLVGSNPIINRQQNGKKQEFKTIHWKKHRPLSKFFHNKKKWQTESKSVIAKETQKGVKQVEGRKLYQLLTLNRQLIELEDF